MSKNNKFITINPEKDYRLIAISDIHGGLHLLKQLLEKAELRAADYLVLIGDCIEKGPYSTEMVQYMKELSQRPNTFVLSGNCESYVLSLLTSPEWAQDLLDYIQSVRYPSLITAWCEKLGIDRENVVNSEALQQKLADSFREDIDFLEALPLALELDDFIFVHAGVEPIVDWTESDPDVLLAYREFLYQGHCCGKYVAVGHWPVSNYREQSLCGDIIIDHDKRIISIDGGYGVKTTGQLNALIIEKLDGQYKLSSQSIDPFTDYRVVKAQIPLDSPVVKIDWRDNAIELLEKGIEFSPCRKLGTGEPFLIKNELIEAKEEGYICNNDYISLFLEAEIGDTVRVEDFYGEYALAKYRDELGWIRRDALLQVK